MASKPKKRKSGRTTPPLTRDMLLPMAADLASKVSLHNHLALVALRRGQGNADLIAELLKTVYVAFDLLDTDQRAALAEQFVRAEASIKAVIKNAAATDEWRLAEEECQNVELILGLHDQQLVALPKHLIDAAKQRLMRVLAKGSFPELAGCW
jgi:NAD(P)-dependent dehydrogenase (short-subunit alcohol dehydrogenase family)